MLIPDSAHGTNPASAHLSGFSVKTIRSTAEGLTDLEHLRELCSHGDVAGLMLTNPNTLGLFERNIKQICDIVHEAGGLVYMDGANMNALVGVARPGDMGVDVIHLNLHKTFSTPHGGGGPGCGPCCCTKELEPFLPVPRIVKSSDSTFRARLQSAALDRSRKSILWKLRHDAARTFVHADARQRWFA